MSNYIHPVHAVNDGIISTYSGKKANLAFPTAEMVCLEDVANALSKINRFGGHTKQPYNVAQHSLVVMALAPDHLKKPALIHDNTEVYLGDVVKPLKILLGEVYETLEDRWLEVIINKYGVTKEDILAIKPYDKQALEMEHEFFFKGGRELEHFVWNNFGTMRTVWDSDYAKIEYTSQFVKLFGRQFQ